MAKTLAELQAQRDTLHDAIVAGERRVSFGDRTVEYRDVAEMQRAMAYLDREIEAHADSAVPRNRVWRIDHRKGL